MFKWVTPASTATSLMSRSHLFSATTNTTITTLTKRTTANTTGTTKSTEKQKQKQHQQHYHQRRLSLGLATLIITIIALFAQTASGFRSIEALTNGSGRKLFGGYRITPKHCRATKTLPSADPRSDGPTICMFNHECAQRGGEVVGACMDGFLFGACCQIPETHELASTLINDAQNAYFQQQHQQQQQQQKLQHQQTVAHTAAAQSYETYGEQQQQQQSTYHAPQAQQSTYQTSQTSQNIYDQANIDKVYQQLSSSSTTSSGYGGSSQEPEQSDYVVNPPSSPAMSPTTPHPVTDELEQEATMHLDNQAESANTLDVNKKPPSFHVHKHSVKISSPSSPPQNDDFVMQVLSTLPPDPENDHITFTTEVPTKISSIIGEQISSESVSFEEEPQPSKSKPQVHEPQQLAETMKRPVHHQKPQEKPAEESTNMHHHNHLILDGGEFTHSDITHPGADADLVEDLQFSTGYGPQPVYAEPPKEQSYVSAPPAASNEDKYVLVQTFTNEKRPATTTTQSQSPTTISSITTHVDSIESIILQLNNSNHGPSYNVESQNTPSYGYTAQGTTSRPPAAVYQDEVSKQPVIYPIVEVVKSEHQPEVSLDYTTSYTTVASDIAYDKVSDEQDVSASMSSSQSSEYGANIPTAPPANPSYSDVTSPVLEEHTMPSSSYNDVSAATAPQTSEFNKMPAVGIAYPVDISYPDAESGNASEEPSAYGQAESTASASTESSYQMISTSHTEEPEPIPAYVRPATNSKPNRPVASYIGMVTMQNYNKQPTNNYNQLPAEVSVSSQTTKVQEDYIEPASNYASTAAQQPEKLTNSYGTSAATTTTTPRPISTNYYISSTSTPVAQRPQYDENTSSARPLLVTASPKPNTKRPNVKRPIPSTNIKRKTPPKPQPAKKPSNNYNQESSSTKQPSINYEVEESSVSYVKQPLPSLPIYQDQTDVEQPVPAQPSLTYNEEVASSPTRKAATKKPAATSYVTGPSTPRPPTTVDYHYDKVPPLYMTDDKLNAFIQSTAENIVGSTAGNYQPPLYATASTPVHIERPTTNNNYKKPGFVQVNATPKPPRPTVLITPKPTAINLVTLPSSSSSSITGVSNKIASTTTPIPSYGSTSYIYNGLVTRRPTPEDSTPEYVPAQAVSTNDFEDPGYFGMQTSHVHPAFTQSTTEAVFAVPSDDKPAFPGYYGPTPTYPAFSVPGEKLGAPIEEETFTSPNDFVNFPPVRNPNLNMSAASSAVTSDLELSTPAFVEDIVLKDKMNTLVHKLVASLQGNFEALADMIDDNNNTAATYQASSVATGGTSTRKPTRKPVRVTTASTTVKPKVTTKKPVSTRVSTKAPTKKTSVTTRKPPARRTTVTTTTRKPGSRKPTRRVVTTTTTVSSARPAADEIVDEEDEEDVNPNPQDNEIDNQGTLSSYGGANGRKIQCGVRPHVKSGRIVGGKGSTFGAFPWQVLVRESTWLGLFTKNKCGGVLITSRYVITAAHCQPGFLASLVAVMGEFDISGDLESKRPITKNVKRVIVHRQYDPATFENDLALLELDSAVQFDTHIVPICMPNDQADFTGRMATVTGWGRLKYGGGVPSVLQEVQVPVIENSVCQEMFHTAGHNKKILNSFLCAGYANGQKDSCEGDSGGPLVLQRPDGRYELAGTVSHGIKCAAPYLPGVYMRTTFYKPWLRSITGVK